MCGYWCLSSAILFGQPVRLASVAALTPEPLDILLEKLTTGDDRAAEHVFRSYEPFLRMVVRRHLSPELRSKFDSIDVVQSVWVHLIKDFRDADRRFTDVNHLRSFLVQITRHRLIDRLRHLRPALEREQPLEGAGLEDLVPVEEPQPADVLQADELWEQLLELCPPGHQEILRLKREGALTGEVAARTGLDEGSIRRILGTLSKRLERERKKEGP
jgi:RNA polymerase sigma-70 factor (ECF subfamily)